MKTWNDFAKTICAKLSSEQYFNIKKYLKPENAHLYVNSELNNDVLKILI